MKKLVILLAATAMTVVAFSQSDTISFAANSWNLPEGSSAKQTEEATFSNGTYSITLGTQGGEKDGYYYSSKHLMLGQAEAYLTLPAFAYAVERIDIVGTSGASEKVEQNIFVGNTAVSTATAGAKNVTNEYVINTSYRTIGTRYTLKVLSAHNTQISKIIVYAAGAAPTNFLDSIAIANPKTEFYKDTKFAFGGTVIAHYSNGTRLDVTDQTQFSGYDISKIGEQTITASFTDTELKTTKKTTYTITVKERPSLPQEATTYTSNISLMEENGVKATAITVVIADQSFPAMKVGTTSDQGSIYVTIPATTETLHFHVAGAPSNTNAWVKISSNLNDSITSLPLIADPGFTGSSKTLTLEGYPDLEHYAAIQTNGATQIKFEASKKSNCRFLLYGVNANPAPPSDLNNIQTTGNVTKKLVNGQIIITVNGKDYSILGL